MLQSDCVVVPLLILLLLFSMNVNVSSQLCRSCAHFNKDCNDIDMKCVRQNLSCWKIERIFRSVHRPSSTAKGNEENHTCLSLFNEHHQCMMHVFVQSLKSKHSKPHHSRTHYSDSCSSTNTYIPPAMI